MVFKFKPILYFILLICPALVGLFLLFFKEKTVEMQPLADSGFSVEEPLLEESSEEINPITGLPCQNAQRRPIGVMLANDTAARPLSGISEADIVFEMPVITDSITRLMAVFICNDPKEIGSIRSARHDFIPLAKGIDAIYAHWGGSHFALDKLRAKVINNIDALINPYNAFYRKSGIVAPHNGFTSMKRLLYSAEKLGYRLENKFEGYPHYQNQISSSIKNQKSKIKIGYSYPFNVEWQYNPETNSYLRWRGNKKEIDKNNEEQVEVKNIVVMRAESRQIEGQYNDVEIEGSGEAEIYNNGQVIKAIWQKDKNNPQSKLYFLDEQDKEIKFVPGKIWIEIVQPNTPVILIPQ